MNNVWSMIINYLLSAVSLGMTFLYGSTGEILTEKSGHLNLGIPGIMCFGAAGGCIALELMSGSIGKTPAFIIVVIGILASFLLPHRYASCQSERDRTCPHNLRRRRDGVCNVKDR